MHRAWLANLPPAAALVTFLSAWVLARAAAPDADGLGHGAYVLLSLPAPIVVSMVWGLAAMWYGRWRPLLWPAVAWLVVGFGLLPAIVVGQVTANVAAGAFAGMALTHGWRLDRALLVVAGVLLPLILWAAVQMPVREQMEMVGDQTVEILDRNLPAGADDEQRAEALAGERRRMDRVVELAVRLYPALLGIGLLGQAGILLGLLRWSARGLGLVLPGWNLPPFSQWRLPFYLVWLLVLGLGLLLTRAPYLADAGLNLACVAALVISVQGLAVQFFVTGRLLPPVGRVVYWTIMGVFFALVVLASGVVLGLADQWWDVRRLQVTGPADGDPHDE